MNRSLLLVYLASFTGLLAFNLMLGVTPIFAVANGHGEFGGAMSTATLETYVDLSRNRLEMMLKVLDVDGAVKRVKGGWEATGHTVDFDPGHHDDITLFWQQWSLHTPALDTVADLITAAATAALS